MKQRPHCSTTGDTITLAWNADNKPSSITRNGQTTTFTYDGRGMRVKKTGTQVTYYFGEVYEKRGPVGIFHIFAGNQRILSLTDTGTETYSHPNHLGSASMITDGNGLPTQKVEYYPFGTYRGQPPVSTRYTFTDQEDDDEFGFYTFKARLYDPLLGRFLSPDSIVQAPGDPQTLNRYSYCLNNPLIYVDPSGHYIETLVFAIAIGAAIGAGVAAATGGNIGQGALTGAISGAIFGGAGEIVHVLEGAGQLASITKAGIHAGAGVVSGGINAGVTGGNIGMGMLAGGLAAGISAYVGVEYLPDNDAAQIGGRVLLGGTIGGATSAALGGDFGKGFMQGGMSALMGELLNDLSSPNQRRAQKGADGKWYVSYDGKMWVEAAPEDQARYEQRSLKKLAENRQYSKVKGQIALGGMAVITAVALGGELALTVYLANPQATTDFLTNLLGPTPSPASPPTKAGWLGTGTAMVIDSLSK